MRHHPKSVLAVTLSIAASIWWLSLQDYSSKNIDEREYSRQECAEDLCQVSVDLAQFALNRGDLNAAVRNYERAIEHKPDALLPYQKLSQCYLQQGLADQAVMTYFTARHATATFRAASPVHDARALLQKTLPWQGEAIAGKKLYVEGDANLDDSICFARFLPLLAERGADVHCKVPDALLSLYKNSMPAIHFFTESLDADLPSFDFYLTEQSLPALLRVAPAAVMFPHGYLVPELAHAESKKALFVAKKLRVGLWLYAEKNNAVPVSLFDHFSQLPHVQLYALQSFTAPGNVAIVDLSQHCRTLHDVAAVTKNLDVLIAVESPATHIAGSVGTPVWLLAKNKFIDWRWELATSSHKSIWYPGMRVFQQPKAGDWLSVVADVHELLSAMGKTPVASALPSSTSMAASIASGTDS